MIRPASRLPTPLMEVRTASSPARIASCRSATGRLPTIAERDLGAHAGHREEEPEEAELVGRPEPVEGLEVLPDEVVRVELEPLPGLRRGEHAPGPRRPGTRCPPTSRTRLSAATPATSPSTEAIIRRGRGAPRSGSDGRPAGRSGRRPVLQAVPSHSSSIRSSRARASRTARSYGVSPAGRGAAAARSRMPGVDPLAGPFAVGGPDRDRQRVGGVVGVRAAPGARGSPGPSARPGPSRRRRTR